MTKRETSKRFDVPVLESLEPRVLYSADPLGFAIGSVLSGDDVSATYDADQLLSVFPDSARHVLELQLESELNQQKSLELVFVSEHVENYQSIVERLSSQSDDQRELVVFTVDDSAGSLETVTDIIKNYKNVSVIHILSHGSDGNVLIGSDVLSRSSIDQHSANLTRWGEALIQGGDILFYACDLASDDSGETFVRLMNEVTGADIAASTDLTGHHSLGGNWELEYVVGEGVKTGLVLAEELSDWDSLMAVLEVTTPDDVVDAPDLSSVAALLADPGSDGFVSLREAVIAANSAPDQDAIFLKSDTYEIVSGATMGDIDISQSVKIFGEGSGESVIDANGADRIFTILGGTTIIENVGMIRGESSTNGGAIYIENAVLKLNSVDLTANVSQTGEGGAIFATSLSTVEISDSTLIDNRSGSMVSGDRDGGAIYSINSTVKIHRSLFLDNHGRSGGAIYSDSLTVIEDSTFTDHDAEVNGGAIYNLGTVNIENSLFNLNHSDDSGGAIFNNGTANITNTVITNNDADNDGGALVNVGGTSTILDTTIVRNDAGDAGGGVDLDGGAVLLRSSIIALNTASAGDDVVAGVTSQGFNLFGDPGITAAHYSDFIGADPMIANNLSYQGGHTETLALLPGSPAIDSGASFGGLDGTHTARNEISDIGAFEFRQTTPVSKIYWGVQGETAIYRGNSDGTGAQKVVNDIGLNVLDIEVDIEGGRLLWVESDDTYGVGGNEGHVNFAHLNGSPIVTVSPLFHPQGLAYDTDNHSVFVGYDVTTHNDVTANNLIIALDATALPNATTIAAGDSLDTPPEKMASPLDVEYDPVSGLVYWSDYGYTAIGITTNKGIQSVDPSVGQSSMQTVVSLANGDPLRPMGLTVLPGATEMYWASGGGKLTHTDLSSGTPVHTTSAVLTTGELQNVQYDEVSDLLYVTDSSGEILTVSRDFSTTTPIFSGYSDTVAIATGSMSLFTPELSLVVNSDVTVLEGQMVVIDSGSLTAIETDTNPTDLVYTLDPSSPLQYGTLQNSSGTPLSSFTQLNIDQGQIFYQHNGVGNLSDSLVFTVSDPNGNSTPTETLTITVSTLNDAPTITSLTLPAEDEDNNGPGYLISTIYSSAFSDEDAGGTLEGIVIENDLTPASSGQWEYSLDNGGSWIVIGPVSPTSALVLEATARLRFAPFANWSGTTQALTIRPLDNTYYGAFSASGGPHHIDTVAVPSGGSSFMGLAETLQAEITPVNDIPLLSNDFATSYLEDAASIPASSVSAMFNAGFSDVESSAIAGIVVTSNTEPATSGTWQYSTDGTTWFDVGSVSAANGLLLDANTDLRFAPAAHYNGSPASLIVRAIDDSYTGVYTVGGAWSRMDTTVMSSDQSFSEVDRTLSVSITSVNDTPTVGDAFLTNFSEDPVVVPGATVSALFDPTFSDFDGGLISGIVVTSNTEPVSSGAWQYSTDGTNWFDVGFVSTTTALAFDANTELRFAPATHYNGSPAGLLVRALDSSYTGGYTAGNSHETVDTTMTSPDQFFSAVDRNLSVQVMPVNDTPTVGNATLPAFAEDSPVVPSASVNALFDPVFTDVEDAGISGIVITSNTEPASSGAWQHSIDGINWFDVGAVSATSGLIVNSNIELRFSPASDYNGVPADLAIRAVDSSYTGPFSAGVTRILIDTTITSSDQAFSTVDRNLSVQISPVNDTPGVGNAALPVFLEDTATIPSATVSSLYDPSFIDVEDLTVSGLVVTSNTEPTSSGAWQYSTNSVNWFDVGAVSSTSGLLLDANTELRFAPATNFNGVPADLIIRVLDSSYTSAYTVDAARTTLDTTVVSSDQSFSSVDRNLSVQITAVNDSPTIADAGLPHFDEDSAAIPTASVGAMYGPTFVDVETATIPGIVITSNTETATSGAWQYSTDSINWYDIGSVTTSSGLLLDANTELRFAPALDYNGTPDHLVVRAMDSSYSGAYTVAGSRSSFDTTVTSPDQAFSTVDSIFRVAVDPVSDAPTTGNSAVTIVEGGSHTFSVFEFPFADPADSDIFKAIEIESLPTIGSLSLNGLDVVVDQQITVGNIPNLIYTPPVNFSGAPSPSFNFSVVDSGLADGGGPVISATQGTMLINVTPVNDSPIFTDAALPASEEDGTPSVMTVAALYSAGFSDNDPGDTLKAVAIVDNSNNAANGAWQFSTDGISWYDIGSVDNSAALILDATTSLRFLPSLNFNGSPTPLELHALDSSYPGLMTVGSAKVLLDVTATGASTSVSALPANLSTTVNPVNDSPVGANSVLAPVSEDTLNPVGATVSALVESQFSDVDIGSSMSGVGLIDNVLSTDGQWEYSVDGINWNTVGNVSINNVLVIDLSTQLRFVPNPDFNGPVGPLGFKVLDNSYSGIFTDGASTVHLDLASIPADSAFSQSNYLLDSSITPVSDAPSSSDEIVQVNEDGQYVFSMTDFPFSDLADSDAFSGIVITSVPVTGTLTYNGSAVNSPLPVSVGNLGGLVYTPAADDDGQIYRAFIFKVVDDGSNVGDGQTESAQSYMMEIQIVPENDAPLAGSAALPSIVEDSTPSMGETLQNLFSPTYNDPDTGASFTGVAVVSNQAQASDGQWQYSTDGSSWFDVGPASDSNALLLEADTRVRFMPEPDFEGTPDPLQIRVIDDTYTGGFTNGGTRTSTNVSVNGGSTAFSGQDSAIGINVTGINDSPTMSDAVLPGIPEDTLAPPGETLGNLFSGSYNDVDATSPGSEVFAITGLNSATGTVATGEWQYSTDGVNWHELGAVSDANALVVDAASLIRYVPEPDSFGAIPDLLVRAVDDTYAGGTTAGLTRITLDTSSTAIGQSFSAEPYLVTSTVSSVYDQPTGADNTITLQEDGEYQFDVGDFGFLDTDPSDSLSGIIITSLPAAGSLTLDGSEVTVDQLVSVSDIASGLLLFTPEQNAYSETYATFDFKVVDDSAAPGGLDTSASSVFTVDVEAVSDLPDSIDLSGNQVDENVAEAVVGSVSVVDPDTTDTHSVTVDDPRFEIVNGNLKLRAGESLNFEEESQIPLILTALGSDGLSYQQNFLIDVQDLNDSPVLSGDIENVSGTSPFSFQLPGDAFFDEDGDVLTYSVTQANDTLSALPSWLVFDEQTRTFTVGNVPSSVGSIPLLVTATDEHGETANVQFDLIIEPSLGQANPIEPSLETPEVEEEPEPEEDVETTEEEIGETAANPSGEEDSLPDQTENNTTDFLPPVDSVPTPLVTPTENFVLDVKPVVNQEPVLSALRLESSMSLERLFSLSSLETATLMNNLSDQLDDAQSPLDQNSSITTKVLGTSVTVSSGLSVGYILWLIRGGTLVGSVLSALPAWRFIDPLPVLGSLDGTEDDGDDDSLESMVNKDTENDSPVDADTAADKYSKDGNEHG